MATFSLDEIKTITTGKCIEKEVQFTGLSIDSRTIEEGNLFIAIEGEQFDGHDFLEVAKNKKAAGAIVKTGKAIEGFLCIEVDDTLKALQAIASYHRMRFSIPVIAITGSSGKTTTKEMVAAVLETKYNVLKTEKNYNNEIGLPLILLNLTSAHEVCVVEMGMRGFGQIAELADIAKPTIGIVTNVGTSHIELLGSQEGIAKAKGELVEAITEEGLVILNEDDPFVKAMSCKAKGRIIGFGIASNATVSASHLQYKRDGIKFTCKCYDEVFDAFIPMIGTHNVYNALVAVATARALGICSPKIKKGLQHFAGMPMRQELIAFDDFVLLNDCYNANPSSMTEAIKALGQLEGTRKIAILGDMLELGEKSKAYHEEIGKLLGIEKYDIIISYGAEAKAIAQGARVAGVPLVIEGDSHASIAQQFLELQQEGDVVLLKGSRGMTMEAVLKEIKKIKGVL